MHFDLICFSGAKIGLGVCCERRWRRKRVGRWPVPLGGYFIALSFGRDCRETFIGNVLSVAEVCGFVSRNSSQLLETERENQIVKSV